MREDKLGKCASSCTLCTLYLLATWIIAQFPLEILNKKAYPKGDHYIHVNMHKLLINTVRSLPEMDSLAVKNMLE